jgi:uncharacterized protein (TIGR02145 family)
VVEAFDNSGVAATDSARFILMPRLPEVETTPPESVQRGSALLEGTLLDDGGGNVTSAGFLWGLEPDGSDFTESAAEIVGYTFSVNITDLEYDTYFFLAYAENESGRSYSELESFSTPTPEYMFIDERDGIAYEWVRIGNQIWMAENLAYLPELRNPSNSSSEEPFYYVYDYIGFNIADAVNTDNYNKYGVLYNYTAAHDACPDGWHLPTTAEEKELISYIGGSSRVEDLMETGTDYWNSNPSGTNATGFSARGAGRAVIGQNGAISFEKLRDASGWWRADTCATDTTFGLPFVIESSDPVIFRDNNCNPFAAGYSVRCVKD